MHIARHGAGSNREAVGMVDGRVDESALLSRVLCQETRPNKWYLHLGHVSFQSLWKVMK